MALFPLAVSIEAASGEPSSLQLFRSQRTSGNTLLGLGPALDVPGPSKGQKEEKDCGLQAGAHRRCKAGLEAAQHSPRPRHL